jgi:amino acid transporter
MAGTPVITEGAENLDVKSRPELHRSIGPFQLALYGLGSMLGSGVYGLMGQAAGQVGNAV